MQLSALFVGLTLFMQAYALPPHTPVFVRFSGCCVDSAMTHRVKCKEQSGELMEHIKCDRDFQFSVFDVC